MDQVTEDLMRFAVYLPFTLQAMDCPNVLPRPLSHNLHPSYGKQHWGWSRRACWRILFYLVQEEVEYGRDVLDQVLVDIRGRPLERLLPPQLPWKRLRLLHNDYRALRGTRALQSRPARVSPVHDALLDDSHGSDRTPHQRRPFPGSGGLWATRRCLGLGLRRYPCNVPFRL